MNYNIYIDRGTTSNEKLIFSLRFLNYYYYFLQNNTALGKNGNNY